jgi:hypothetical protein
MTPLSVGGTPMFVIEDEVLLEALVRALCTLKFMSSPDRLAVREMAGSPLVAEVANRAYDALVDDYRRALKEGYAERAELRRAAEGQPLALEAVRAHLRYAEESWRTWSSEQKRSFVRILLAPYFAGPELVDSLVAGGDATTAPGATDGE